VRNAAVSLLELTIADMAKAALAMVAGFTSELELFRSQTIMEGPTCCDFRFRRKL
jgi:hypothetical protein